jgi:hypothetical protein
MASGTARCDREVTARGTPAVAALDAADNFSATESARLTASLRISGERSAKRAGTLI